jgi:hypothetical protein
MATKLASLVPVMQVRDVTLYTQQQNIQWIEDFFDNVLCVVDSNKLYKYVKISSCKVVNNNDVISNRLYTVTLKYKSGACPLVVKIPFDFSLLSHTGPLAYVAVINISVKILAAQAVELNSSNLQVFL